MKTLPLSSMTSSSLLSELKDVAKKYIVTDGSEKADSETILKNRQFDHLMGLFPGIVCLIDLQTLHYVYISKNVKSILGFPREEFYESGIEKALSLCSPDHNNIMIKKIFPAMFDYFNTGNMVNDVYKLKVAYTNKLMRADMSSRWFLHQASIFHADEDGKPLFMLKTLSDIDFIKKDDSISLTLYKKDDDGLFRSVFTDTFLSPRPQSLLSERETEVLSLMSQGKSSREIADILFISQHTVFNHRKNMLKKMHVKRAGELIKKAMANGYI